MECQKIIELLEKQSPREYALSWDNVGLLVGRRNNQIKKIIITLDATVDVCKKAVDEGYDMILTHHPMIFSKINKINDESVVGNKILMLAENQICCYAMHTNFDTIGGMGREAANMLGLKDTSVLEVTQDNEGIGQIGILDSSITLEELAEKVKECFAIDNVIVYGNLLDEVKRIAVSPGSGKHEVEYAKEKNVQCLITGDIGHHDGIDAVEMGVNIIDASHYGIEKLFMKYIKTYLDKYCSDVTIDIYDEGTPFVII